MNILDNLRPMDAGSALHASIRILKPGGKALIKLNPWLSPGKIKEWNIRTVEMDLRGDGSCIEIKKMFFLSGTAASDVFLLSDMWIYFMKNMTSTKDYFYA